MAEKVLMIALSPTMEEGTIVEWHKKEGDEIETGDVICEVETDKATMDYESAQSGKLLKIVKKQGDKAKVGESIAIIGEEGEDISQLIEEIRQESQTISQKAEQKPQEQEQKAQPEAQIKEEEPAQPQTQTSKPADKIHSDSTVQNQTNAQVPQTPGRIKASPLARKRAKEKGIDLRTIRGTGPAGRITIEDIEKAEKTAHIVPAVAKARSGRIQGKTIPVTPMRATIAKRLSESKFSSPHFTLTVSVQTDRLLELRQRVNSKRETKLSLNAFIIKITAEALVRHPVILSSWQQDSIKLFDTADIALAVALPEGLITPVVRSAEDKTISTIDSELADLIERAKQGKLEPGEYTGAGFTISNLGSYGIDEFSAIINPPGSAILAVGAIKTEPIYDGQSFVAAKMMRLTLSCDHRTIDGAQGADFMRTLKSLIEDPAEALI